MKKYILFILIILALTLYSLNDYLNDIKILNKEKTINQINDNYSKNTNYYQKKYKNKEIIGKLQIENLNFSSLVMQTNNNEYYLNHLASKEENILGSLFLDYRSKVNGKKQIIYGHSSNTYEVPFKNLEKYFNKNFYNKHKYIYFTTEKKHTYIIFSIFKTKDDYTYYDMNITNYKKHLKYLKNKSIYNTKVNINNEKLLILQTCSNEEKDTYIIICGKEIV